MSQPDIPPVESGLESFSKVEMQSTQMDSAIKGQLSQPQDVQAAHNYFQTGGTELQTGLPDLSLDSGMPQNFSNSLDLGTNQALYGNPNTLGFQGTGGESALLNGMAPTGLEGGGLMPGLEQGVIAGMPPGTEPISPMIQMILKMPGLTGTVASFFEAIMSFLFPADGGFLTLLDPTMWAQTAQQAFGSLITAISDNIPLSISFMQNTSPFFSSLMNNGFLHNGLFESLGKTASTLQSPDLSFSGLDMQPVDANASNMFVNGQVSPGKPLFETGAYDGGELANGSVNIAGNGDLLAFDNGNSFGATMGGYSPPTSVDPQSITSTTASNTTVQAPQTEIGQPSTDASQVQSTDTTGATTHQRGELLNRAESNLDADPQSLDSTSIDGSQIAENNIGAQPQTYTIQSGDSLWDIAREQLGSGTKWTELYQLNADSIGSNPNLIFSGNELQLPQMENIAQAHDYVVQPGDNLWNIAKDNMGSGTQWPSLYHQNADIIGSDPNLIHPGQHLAVSGQNPGSVQVAHHHVPQTHHHSAPSHHAPKVAHHAKHSSNHHQAKPTNHSQKSNDSVEQSKPESDTSTLAADNPVDTTADTILKQAQNTAAAAKDQLEKTANAAQPSPMGLRAVAKTLDI